LSGLAQAGPLRRLTRGHKIAALAGACLLVAAAMVASIGSADGAAHTALPAARSLTLGPVGQTGHELSLNQYRGRAVLINFFASWCVPCKKETPLLSRFFRAHHGQVPIIGVDVNDNTAAAMRFIHAAGVTYPVGSDPAGSAATRYGVVAIPQTFFLNASHRIVKRVFGAVTLAELNVGLARMR
jgi:thiol-disulfide isomerase/thioredoxin